MNAECVDRVKIDQFTTEEAEAKKIGVCYACHEQEHFPRNCPQLLGARRQSRVSSLGGGVNCGQKDHQ